MKPTPTRIALLAIFVAGTFLFLDWIPDDAYISYRYAENLASGHGLVFNPGERVEGFSNPLWTVTLALLRWLGFNVPAAALLLSLACAYLVVMLSLQLFERIAPDEASLRLPFGLALVASLPMVFWASSGMETHAEAALVLVGALLHLRALSANRPQLEPAAAAAFAGVALIRPEGVALLAVHAAMVLVNHRWRPPRVVWVGLLAAGAVALLAWLGSWVYYGELLPNTYWAKPGASFDYPDPIARGLRYLWRYGLISGLLLFVPTLLFVPLTLPAWRASAYVWALAQTQVAFIVFVGGDVLLFDRFAVVLQPLVLALALMGAVSLAARGGRLRVTVMAVVWMATAVCVGLNGARAQRALSKYCEHDWMHSGIHVAIGEVLPDVLPEGSTLLLNEVGAIPYYSRMRTIDMIGLTDRAVGRIIYESYQRYGTTDVLWCGEQIADVTLPREPTCVALPSRGAMDRDENSPNPVRSHGIWAGIYRAPDFQRNYSLRFVVVFGDHKHLNFFVRNGTPVDLAPLAKLSDTLCASVILP